MKTAFQIRRTILLICLLVFLPATTYWHISKNEFIDLDDNAYVTENSRIRQGVTIENISWAFRFNNADYWLPLAWISHMIDCSLFGLNPGWHHLTSLSIHIVNGLLLFFFLLETTGSPFRSLAAALLFSVHPINVDSVAWIAERKNVLSAFFWMLTLLSYAFYVRTPTKKRYLVILVCFICGSMAKPLLITLPFLLLLLDYWPLGRLKPYPLSPVIQLDQSAASSYLPTVFRLVKEKIPLFALSMLSILLTLMSLKRLGHLVSGDQAPLTLRVANALVSYIKYISKAIWPRHFSIHYPYPTEIPPPWQLLGSFMLIFLVTLLSVHQIKKRPYLIVGWLWFLGTFVPAIGLTYSGVWGAINDRFAYIPLIGLFIAVVWGVSGLLKNSVIKAAMAATGIFILAAITYLQVPHWKNSRTLFEHALSVTEGNYFVHNLLGAYLAKQGDISAAIDHYRASIRIRPNYFEAHNNLGIALARSGKLDDAIRSFHTALEMQPAMASAHNNLANVLADNGRTEEAEAHYIQAIRIRPDYTDAYTNLGILYFHLRQCRKSIDNIQFALRIDPDSQKAHAILNLVRKQCRPSAP
ncbi:MAG: tetratricopeptide repeat protein [Thermodesulfobacteriota bacterium]